LPQVWKVPARNPHFTGRGAELEELAGVLAAGAAVTVHSVHGVGGVGKTQLAAERAHAHAHARDYDVGGLVLPGEVVLTGGHRGVRVVVQQPSGCGSGVSRVAGGCQGAGVLAKCSAPAASTSRWRQRSAASAWNPPSAP
jgi:hypothetical protein